MEATFAVTRRFDDAKTGSLFTFGDMCRVLGLHPSRFPQDLPIEIEVDKADMKFRPANYNPAVNIAKLAKELAHTTSGANLFTIVTKIPFGDLHKRQFVIPKGEHCGMFDSFHGGGAMMDVELIRDMEIDLDAAAAFGEDKEYSFWRIVPDCASGYSCHDVYGGWPGR